MRKLWIALTPYGKVSEYVAEYAEAVVADDLLQLQTAVLALPIDLDVPLYPTLTPNGAFGEVDDGGTVCILGAPIGDCEGCWVDSDGEVKKEPSMIVSDPTTAYLLGKGYNQQVLLKLSATEKGSDGYLWLLKDTAANRGIALSVGGGYTAGQGYLLVASTELLPTAAIEGNYDCIPVRVAYIKL